MFTETTLAVVEAASTIIQARIDVLQDEVDCLVGLHHNMCTFAMVNDPHFTCDDDCCSDECRSTYTAVPADPSSTPW